MAIVDIVYESLQSFACEVTHQGRDLSETIAERTSVKLGKRISLVKSVMNNNDFSKFPFMFPLPLNWAS